MFTRKTLRPWFDEVRQDPGTSYWVLKRVFGTQCAEAHRRITNRMINGLPSQRAVRLLWSLLRQFVGIIKG